ncbi:MAG: hypothetical protein GY859_33470 [Desulfobacterales bacterium]|nr:hypothetical protein [Desulfobacterales bacterium]
MGIVFDEVVGEVEDETPPKPEELTPEPPRPPRPGLEEMEQLLCRLKWREARLFAD